VPAPTTKRVGVGQHGYAGAVLNEDGYVHKMQAAAKNAMTPLFTSNINPFGDIHLDINRPSFLEMH
jgi:hypothetical protein